MLLLTLVKGAWPLLPTERTERRENATVEAVPENLPELNLQ